jgi:DNA primase
MNVEDLLRSKDLSFIPKGNDYVVRCINPEHLDRNPSMRVDKITGIFNCFSCGYKGNLYHHFGERVNRLHLKRELLKKKIRLKRAESVGLAFPQDCIPYVGNWRNIKPETYKQFEAFQNHSTEYIGRIMFPIRNLAGKVVAFVGRHTTGGTPKYLISPAGARMPLYPVVQPIKGSVILVEGIFDMLNLHDKGLTNAVCCFGTKVVNEDKLAMLKMQGVESIDIFFDGDEAGQKAAQKIGGMCEHIDLMSRNICLEGTDPGALLEPQIQKLMRKLYK